MSHADGNRHASQCRRLRAALPATGHFALIAAYPKSTGVKLARGARRAFSA